jgi:uncharacterized OB-fold protein
MTVPSEAYDRPLPRLEGFTGEFYEFLRQHELRFQRCTSCGLWRHVPRELCPQCKSGEFEWARSAGSGHVFSWTRTKRTLHPAFADTPLEQIVVELDEGPRLLTRLAGEPDTVLSVGLPVEIAYEDVTPEVTLAVARPVTDR